MGCGPELERVRWEVLNLLYLNIISFQFFFLLQFYVCNRKPIPIQGTNIKLDTPEQIEAWIAERKKRFPTAERVQEKEKLLEEAIARGQLSPVNSRFPQRKKRRTDEYQSGGPGARDANDARRGRGRGHFGDRGRARGRGRGRDGGRGRQDHNVQDSAIQETTPSTSAGSAITQHQLPPRPAFTYSNQGGDVSKGADARSDEEMTSNSDSDSDLDDAPEVASSKPPPEVLLQVAQEKQEQELAEQESNDVLDVAMTESKDTSRTLEPPRKPFARQPRAPPRNPFAQRSSLLRNVCNHFAHYPVADTLTFFRL